MKFKYTYLVLKLIIPISALYVLIFKPEYIYIVFSQIFYYANSYIDSYGFMNFLLLICIFIILFIIVKILTEKMISKLKLKYLDYTDNTFSKGMSVFATNKECHDFFVAVEHEHNYTLGMTLHRYAEVYIKIGILKFRYKVLPFYQQQETKKYETIQNSLQADGYDIDAQTRILKNYQAKQKLDKYLKSNKYLVKDKMLIDTRPLHTLIVGTSRSGKTQMFNLPQLYSWANVKKYENKPSLVIGDLKGEAYRFLAPELRRNGYNVICINLHRYEYSHSYNPLELIKMVFLKAIDNASTFEDNKFIINNISDERNRISYLLKNIDDENEFANLKEIRLLKRNIFDLHMQLFKEIDFSKVEDLILNFAKSFIPVESDKDPFWEESAQELVCSFLFFMLEECYIDQNMDKYNLYNISIQITKLVDPDSSGNFEYKQHLNKRDSSSFVKQSFPKAEGKTLTSILQSTTVKLKIFKQLGLGKMTSQNQIDFESIVKGERPTAIFLITPSYKIALNKFISIFVNQLFNYANEYCDDTQQPLKRKLHFMLDEFANIPKLDDLTPKLTTCLTYNIFFTFIIQNKSQLFEKYGDKDAETILDNCQNKIYMLSGENETREWFSKQLGQTTILSHSYSGKDYSDVTKSTTEEIHDLVTPDELALNPMGQCYISSLRFKPMKSTLKPFFMYKDIITTSPKDDFENGTYSNLHNHLNKTNLLTK